MKKGQKFLILFASAAITFGSLFAFAPKHFTRHGQHFGNNNYGRFNQHQGYGNCSNNMDSSINHRQCIQNAGDTTKTK